MMDRKLAAITAKLNRGREAPDRPKLKDLGPLFRQHLQITFRLLGDLTKASPGLTLVYSLQAVIQGLLVPAQVFVSAGLIGSIVASIAVSTDGSPDPEAAGTLRVFIIAWLALQVVPMAIGILNQVVSMALLENFQHRLNQKLMLAANRVEDLGAFEGENIFNDSAAIRRELQFRPLAFVNGMFAMSTSLIALTMLSGVIVRYAIEIPIIAAALGLLVLFLRAWVGKRIWGGTLRQSTHARMMDYVFSLCYSRDSRQEIRIYGLNHYVEDKFTSAFRGMKKIMNRTRRDVALVNLLVMVPHVGLLAWLILVVVGATHETAADVTGVVLLLNGALALQGQVSGFSSNIGNVIGNLAYFQKFYSFTEHLESYLPARAEKVRPVQVERVEDLSFDGCTFRYGNEEKPALLDVTFKARHGERIAIVGRNGAGKSTLMKLALGLYRPQAGKVSVNQTDLVRTDVESYWARCAVCFQDFTKYMFTVGENIAFDNHSRDDLPDLAALGESKLSYATQLGKEFEGEELSVGQWQRLSVLRCLHFAKDRDVVVLDEPTAAIDPLYEDEIFRQFDALSKDKLAFFVTHRLSIIRYATRVLVMDEGRIIDDGEHGDLMKRCDLYRRMYSAQADKYIR